MAQQAKLFKNRGKPPRKTWSQKFLELAGSAPDFPYPQEPQPIASPPGHKCPGYVEAQPD